MPNVYANSRTFFYLVNLSLKAAYPIFFSRIMKMRFLLPTHCRFYYTVQTSISISKMVVVKKNWFYEAIKSLTSYQQIRRF